MAVTANVGAGLDRLAKQSGEPRGELSRRFHRIKRRGATPGPTDINYIDDQTGDVYGGPGGGPGDYIGNVFSDF